MIRVAPQPPPAHYVAQVQRRGAAFLARNPQPAPSDWKNHAYWQAVHDDLYQQYQGICMYCASWTARRPTNPSADGTTIDHFVPKSVNPQLAYQWSNFRLSRARLNHRKDSFQDVLDPFLIDNTWFSLDFTTFFVRPSDGVVPRIAAEVSKTISRLQLNSDSDYVNERVAIVRAYCLDKVNLQQLTRRYPFVAEQIRRQAFDRQYKTRFAAYFRGQINLRP